MINAIAIKNELKGVRKGMRGQVVSGIARQFGVSEATIYRVVRKEFGASKNIVRVPKIEDRLIDKIGKMKLEGRALGMTEREISTEVCINILKNEMVVGAENLTVSTVNRRLREKGFRQRDIIVRVEPDYANQQHQLDFSRSKYFNIHKKDGDDLILKVSRVLAYKEDGKKLRLWLGGIVDSFSRIAVARAYAATGESTLLGLKLMRFAYNRSEDELNLMHLPEVLKMDNGPLDNKQTDQMLEKLGIKKELVMPYEKRGIQKQESVWRLMWQRFELPLALKIGNGGTIHLSDYNDLLHEFMIENQATEHPVRSGSKAHNYLSSITAHPVRRIERDISEYIFKTWKRKVNNDLVVSVTFKGEQVKLKAPAFALDKWIGVYISYSGEFMGELSDEYHKPFALEVTEGFISLGNFEHREHQTYKEKLEGEIKEDLRLSSETDKKSKINYIPPTQEIIEPKSKFDEAEYSEDYKFNSVYEAKAYIGKMVKKGKNYTDYKDIFDEFLEDEEGLIKRNIDSVISAINNPKKAFG